MGLENWMADHQDKRLGEIHLPGAHDAGTTKNYIDKTVFGSDSNAATQDLTISQQLMAGTRFFDLRLKSHNSKVVPHHTTGGQGAYGKLSVDRILNSASLFCSMYKTEVAIFRISHTSLTTNAHQLAKDSDEHGMLHTGTGNLCNKTIGEIVAQGGGLVCIFDSKKFGTVIDQRHGVHSFSKYSDNPADARGISTCGCYKGTHKLHEVIRNGLRGMYDHNENHNETLREHLWQVYWQKTYLNPASTTGIETGTKKAKSYKGGKIHGGTHAATDHMIKLMKGHQYNDWVKHKDYVIKEEESHKVGKVFKKKVVDKEAVMFSTLPARNFMLPNIISYDFVNETINRKIVALNNNGGQED